MNKSIIESSKRAAKIVFQSQFSKEMCSSLMRTNFDNSVVIYNGISFKIINETKSDTTIEPGSFVACADWRHNKRPLSTIKGFIEASTDRHLYMIGDGIQDKIKHKKVHYLGKKNHKELIAILKACQYQIHLCHIDSCPNSVVEGLACGLNVLHTNLGGTTEIVKKDGVRIDCDEQINGPIKKKNLDNLDSAIIAKGIHSLLQIKNRAVRPDLEIKNVCNEYVNCFRAIL